mmetsp:Transcript_13828/g.24973  ORF Transcript_13828/g.24973 Transcript_13828/m.24973 type:complete len:313 (+) Transcript_13828:3115-4053(+)
MAFFSSACSSGVAAGLSKKFSLRSAKNCETASGCFVETVWTSGCTCVRSAPEVVGSTKPARKSSRIQIFGIGEPQGCSSDRVVSACNAARDPSLSGLVRSCFVSCEGSLASESSGSGFGSLGRGGFGCAAATAKAAKKFLRMTGEYACAVCQSLKERGAMRYPESKRSSWTRLRKIIWKMRLAPLALSCFKGRYCKYFRHAWCWRELMTAALRAQIQSISCVTSTFNSHSSSPRPWFLSRVLSNISLTVAYESTRLCIVQHDTLHSSSWNLVYSGSVLSAVAIMYSTALAVPIALSTSVFHPVENAAAELNA